MWSRSNYSILNAVLLNSGRMTRSGYLSRGVERFLFAMDAVYRRLCPEQTGICTEFYTNGRKQILNTLKKVRNEDEFDVYEFLPDTQGYSLFISSLLSIFF